MFSFLQRLHAIVAIAVVVVVVLRVVAVCKC